MKELTWRELCFIEEVVIAPLSPELQLIARGWIEPFTMGYLCKRQYDILGRKDPEIEKAIDLLINNAVENLHASIEEKAVPILRELCNGDGSILSDTERYHDFSFFIAMQYFRTPGMLKAVLKVFQGSDDRFNVEAAFGLMRTIFATNVGASLVFRRLSTRITFVEAEGEHSFITGDQPVLNLRASGLPEGEEPTELEFYYPLTPTRALLINFDSKHGIERIVAGPSEVLRFNKEIASVANEQLYASREAEFLALNA